MCSCFFLPPPEPPPPSSPPPPPPPPPPAPNTVARFATAHSLGDNGRCCTVCRSSATSACVKAWLGSECAPLENINGRISRLPRGRRLHVAGGWAHPSHALFYHVSLDVWHCAQCGFFAQSQLRGLGGPCKPDLITKSRREYLDRISRDLFPKV